MLIGLLSIWGMFVTLIRMLDILENAKGTKKRQEKIKMARQSRRYKGKSTLCTNKSTVSRLQRAYGG
jgi:hypothetical protein